LPIQSTPGGTGPSALFRGFLLMSRGMTFPRDAVTSIAKRNDAAVHHGADRVCDLLEADVVDDYVT